MTTTYEVYALRYATVERLRKDNFLYPVSGGEHERMRLDFYVWLVRGGDRVILVDTGFSPVSATVRKREFLIHPREALARMGHAASDITDVVITHLHYDHAGNIGDFDQARVWVQEREIRFATGRDMCAPAMSHFFCAGDVGALVARLYEGQVKLVDGFSLVCPGVELHRIGGHTDGLQAVRVRTDRGWVLLASDAAHYYENLETGNPFPAIFDIDEMLAGYARMLELAQGGDIVPGHDPAVRDRYPDAGIQGVSVQRIA